MWGNRTGWGISAVIAIVMIGLMMSVQRSSAHSGMTAKFAGDSVNLDIVALSPAPETILPPMAEDCDAADKYREAIELYNQSPSLYAGFNPKTLDRLEAVEKLVEGTHCKKMTLFSKDPGEIINFEKNKPAIEALRALGQAASLKGLALLRSGKKDEARKYAEAAFSLGCNMYNERIVFEEFEAGLAVMSLGDGLMKQIDPDRAPQIDEFETARIKYFKDKLYDLRGVTHTIDGNMSAQRAGDVFALAERSKERMWRVEACLQLARTHRNVGDDGRASDQRYAQVLLVKIAKEDSDPIVKIAAARARDITDQEYNRQ